MIIERLTPSLKAKKVGIAVICIFRSTLTGVLEWQSLKIAKSWVSLASSRTDWSPKWTQGVKDRDLARRVYLPG